MSSLALAGRGDILGRIIGIAVTRHNKPLVYIAWDHLYLDLVAFAQAHIVFAKLAGNAAQHFVAVGKLHRKKRAGEYRDNLAVECNRSGP